MSKKYTPTNWVANKTVATADAMNNIEKGIEDAHQDIEILDSQIKDIKNKIYAMDFGVKGDGGNYTQELNNALLQSNGGTVVLPEGTIIVDEIINIKEGTILEGSSKKKTIIKKDTTGNLLEFNNPYITYCKNLDFRDITFDGSNVADICLDIYSTSHVNLQNVEIIRFKQGVRFDDVTQPLFLNCTIRDNVENGIILGRQSDSVNIISCDIFNNGNYGLIVGENTNGTNTNTPSTKADGVNIIGTAITKNNIGILIKGSQTTGVNLQGCYFERNSNSHIQISENGGSTVFSFDLNNSFFNGGNVTPIAINSYSINSISVRNNTFLNHNKGAIKLNTATNCKYIRNEVLGGNYAIELHNGKTYTSGNKELVIGKDFYDRIDYVNHGLILPNGSNDTKPTACEGLKGYIYLNKKNSNETDILEVCSHKSDNTFNWIAYQPIQAGGSSNTPTVSQWGYHYFNTDKMKDLIWCGKWVDSFGVEDGRYIYPTVDSLPTPTTNLLGLVFIVDDGSNTIEYRCKRVNGSLAWIQI